MAEYIEKQEIFDAIDLLVTRFPYKMPGRPDTYNPYNEAWCDACSHALDLVRYHTPADVRPVVRGKWIPVTNGRGGSECNLCHAYAPSYQSGAEYNSPFCPNCGAKMKE